MLNYHTEYHTIPRDKHMHISTLGIQIVALTYYSIEGWKVFPWAQSPSLHYNIVIHHEATVASIKSRDNNKYGYNNIT